MNVLGWIGLGIGAWILVGLVVVLVREAAARRAVAEFLLALVVGPMLLTVGVFLRHQAPRAVPLTAEALERWARAQTGHTGLSKRERSAWVLSYRGRGLILVRQRPRDPHSYPLGWLNNIPNRTSHIRHESARRTKR